MILSVVVATYNRQDTIQVTLDRLAKQTLDPAQFEVIVVDDGSPDTTAEVVQAMIPRMPYKLRFYTHANRGPGATENRGIAEAEADLILLIADDIHLEPGTLAEHVEFHRRRPEDHFAALGQVLQSPDMPQTTFQKKWDPFKYWELEGKEVELPYWKFWACQISLKKAFMQKNGLFREHKGAAHEDVELGYRLSKAGLRIIYVPRAMAYHYHPETLASAIRRSYERGKHWRFIEEHVPDPQIWVKYHILNFRTLGYHYQTYRNLSATQLPGEDRNLPWLLTRQLIRWVAFNRFTIPLWIKTLEAADDSPVLASLLHPYSYRGTVFYHFIKGHEDEIRSRGNQGSPFMTSSTSGGQH